MHSNDLESTEDDFALQEKPRICLIDIDKSAELALMNAGFNCTVSSFGSRVRLPNAKLGDDCICGLTASVPPNLHEYDVVVIDLKDQEPIEYVRSEHEGPSGTGTAGYYFLCTFPQNVFDPRPLIGLATEPTITEMLQRDSIVIVFADSLRKLTYQPILLTAHGWSRQLPREYHNYQFLHDPPQVSAVSGLETEVVASVSNKEFRDFMERYNSQFIYEAVFSHPRHWDEKTRTSVKDENFIPLVSNSMEQIVSFARLNGASIEFIFPQLEDKASFLLELFQRHLPAIIPSLFPFNTRFGWLKDEKYLLPNQSKLLAEKEALEIEYADKIAAKDDEIKSNQQEYQFLHDLLTGTGDSLVKTVEYYLKWLGFHDVINCDEAFPGQNEEDLQAVLEDGLLVIEVKGLGGTSTDAECSQINKIRRRRERERGKFDVYPLYIVNHQRFQPPESRTNPPFTLQQVDDAKNDERGLLSTYDLFKLYYAIDSGFITKEDACEALLNYGLVVFDPSASVRIGTPTEVHYNGTVGIFQLPGVSILLGDELIVCENGYYRNVQVIGLQDQGRAVDEASEGEIGLRFSEKITRSSELWKRER